MKKLWIPLTLLGVTALALMVVHVGKGVARGDADSDHRILLGLQIAPVPLNMAGKDPQVVGLGSYLVNTVGGCNGCHSVQEFAVGGDPFQGQPKIIDMATYLAGGVTFTGDDGKLYVSPSLRPLMGTSLPNGLSYPQFLSGLRFGTDFNSHGGVNQGVIQQVSPWPAFRYMTDGDIQAMYVYLSALPPGPPPAQCDPE